MASVIVYADGSCSPNPGDSGIGVLIQTEDRRLELSEYLGQGTNNTAELTAIMRAAQRLRKDRDVVIRTDSGYSIGVLVGGWRRNSNRDLISQVEAELRLLKSFRLEHVRGHRGEPGNELADRLARQAVVTRASVGRLYDSAGTLLKAW